MDNDETSRFVLQKRPRHMGTDASDSDQINRLPDASAIDQISQLPDASAIDRISRLPEGLLRNILSRLTFEDAANTSSVSRTWEYIWMENTLRWKLEIPEKTKLKVAEKFMNYNEIYDTEIVKHTEKVNRALECHKGKHLDELRISAYTDTCEPSQVHNWIKFAIQKGVKTFYLKLDHARRSPPARCSFPSVEEFSNWLDRDTFERPLHHLSRGIPVKHQLKSFCCLKSISLGYFDVGDEVIHYFLQNCVFLEFLHVVCSNTLVNVKVDDGLRLKFLEILGGLNFKSLKIYSKNLISLVYDGNKIDVPFQAVPCNRLELTIEGEAFGLHEENNSGYLSQVETLRYGVTCKIHALICRGLYSFPAMINLKHVNLYVPIGKSLLGYTLIFLAAPNLVTFQMEYRLRRSFHETDEQRQEREDKDSEYDSMGLPHQHLMMVNLMGFHDKPTDIRFAKHLARIAVNLRKMFLKFRIYRCSAKAMRHVREEVQGNLPTGARLFVQKVSD